ncbi:hypothetical protein AC579_6639 [Pseudocercospora musae]|uniref:Uncharacterized protein n=1 Tax=Pseudocercospora musae TaxID=113226 RepID=A0A139IP65_9PEZI|nr:hypothetical protein AC579_6639 [Pseudocercospora musae]
MIGVSSPHTQRSLQSHHWLPLCFKTLAMPKTRLSNDSPNAWERYRSATFRASLKSAAKGNRTTQGQAEGESSAAFIVRTSTGILVIISHWFSCSCLPPLTPPETPPETPPSTPRPISCKVSKTSRYMPTSRGSYSRHQLTLLLGCPCYASPKREHASSGRYPSQESDQGLRQPVPLRRTSDSRRPASRTLLEAVVGNGMLRTKSTANEAQ